jgi:hypothetical protein
LENLPVSNQSDLLLANSKPCPPWLISGQKPVLNHWPEPYTLVEKKENDLDGYLFEDSCLFVS